MSNFYVNPPQYRRWRTLSVLVTISLGCGWSPVTYADSATVLDDIDIYAKKKPQVPDIAVYNRPAKRIAQSTAHIDGTTAARTGSDRLEDFASYTPGVQLVDGNGIGSAVSIRGSKVTQATVDGLPDVQGFYLRDPATLTSIDIAKGRDTTLSGFGTPGGTLHYTTKKPSSTRQRTLTLTTGAPSLIRGQLDITGALNSASDNAWAGRTVLAGQQAQTGYANVGDDRFTVMPSLRWHDAKQSVDLGMEYGWQNRESDDTTILHNGKPIYNVSYVDPRSTAERRMSRVSVDYTRHLNAHWDAKLQTAHIEGKRREQLSSIGFPATDDETLWYSYYRKLDQQQQQTTLKTELQHQTQSQGFKHQTQVGVYNQRVRLHYTSYASYGDGIIPTEQPTFDYALPDDVTLAASALDFRSTWPERAVYLQHQTTTLDDKLALSLGVRNTQTNMDGSIPELSLRSLDTNDTNTSVGITWQAKPHWQFFASHNESFDPNLGFDRQGHLFTPEQNVQHEAGVRYAHSTAQGNPVQASLSTYRIKRENVTTTDPVDSNYRVLTGEVQSKGVEASITQPLTPELQLTAAYAYGDAKITRSNSGLTGNNLSNEPRHSSAVQVTYRPNHATELTLGAVHIGQRPGDNANSFTVDGYTRWDAAAEWQASKKTKLTVGVRNALNKDYIAGSSAAYSLAQGRKRSVTLGWEVNF